MVAARRHGRVWRCTARYGCWRGQASRSQLSILFPQVRELRFQTIHVIARELEFDKQDFAVIVKVSHLCFFPRVVLSATNVCTFTIRAVRMFEVTLLNRTTVSTRIPEVREQAISTFCFLLRHLCGLSINFRPRPLQTLVIYSPLACSYSSRSLRADTRRRIHCLSFEVPPLWFT